VEGQAGICFNKVIVAADLHRTVAGIGGREPRDRSGRIQDGFALGWKYFAGYHFASA
jgi:hypothetical protein